MQQPVNRDVNPRAFNARAVASPVAISTRAPAVENLAGGLSKLSSGLTAVLERRQKEKDERDSAAGLKAVQLGEVTDPNEGMEDRSQSFRDSARAALGEKSGFDMLRKMQTLLAQNGNDPDFDFDAVSQELVNVNIENVDDPNYLKSLYKTFNSRSETLRTAHAEKQAERAIETVQTAVLSVHGDTLSSAAQQKGEAGVQAVFDADRAMIAKWKDVPNASMDDLNAYRIDAIKRAAVESGNIDIFKAVEEKDPNGVALADHDKWGEKVAAAKAAASRAISARTGGADRVLKFRMKEDLLTRAKQGVREPRSVMEGWLADGLIDGGTITAVDAAYTKHHVSAKRVSADAETLGAGLGLGGRSAEEEDITGSLSPDTRVDNVLAYESQQMLESGSTPDAILMNTYARFAQHGRMTKSYSEQLGRRITGANADQALAAFAEVERFKDDPAYLGVITGSLDKNARDKTDVMRSIVAISGEEGLKTYVTNYNDPEAPQAAKEIVGRQYKAINTALEDMDITSATPGYTDWVKRVEDLALGHVIAGKVGGEAAVQNAIAHLQDKSIDGVHVDDVMPFMMDDETSAELETFIASVLAEQGADIGHKIDFNPVPDTILGTVGKVVAELSPLGLGVPGFIFRRMMNPEYVLGAVDPDDVILVPMGDGENVMMYLEGAGPLGTANVKAYADSQTAEERKKMATRHENAKAAAIKRNKARRERGEPASGGLSGGLMGMQRRERERLNNQEESPGDVRTPEAEKNEATPGPAVEPVDEGTSSVPPKAVKPPAGQTMAPSIPELPSTPAKKLVDIIGKRESSDDYTAVNQYGYLGRYQFGAAALVDTGYVPMDKYKAWKKEGGSQADFLDDEDNWSFPGGKDAWLKSTEAQDKAIATMLEINAKRLRSRGALTKDTPADEAAGLLMVAHLGGWSNAVKLAKDPKHDFKDGNGTSIHEYYKLGKTAGTY